MHAPPRSPLLAISLLPLTFALGCASAPTSLPDQPKPAVVVEMKYHSFDPDTVTIKAGEAVLWRNNTLIGHTVTADPKKAEDASHVALPPGAVTFDSGDVPGGKSWQYIFTVPGIYKYICIPHESKGMLGTVIVQAGP